MIRISAKEFESLYKNYSQYGGLYERLLAIVKGEPGNIIAFDETSLPEAYARMLESWLRTGVTFTQTHEMNDALAKLQRAQREQAEANAKAIEAATDARIAWYIKEQGMLDNTHNRDLVFDWFEINKAKYTAHYIDLAVESLASQIQWAVWSPRLQPVEEVRTLPNGEPELPLNATESQMRRASRAQLEDLSKRKGEFRQSRKGSFGSKFFEETVKRDRPLV